MENVLIATQLVGLFTVVHPAAKEFSHFTVISNVYGKSIVLVTTEY